MLSNFNWQQFGLFTLVSVLVYYSVVILLYYRQELSVLFSRRKALAAEGAVNAHSSDDFFPAMIAEAKDESGEVSIDAEELDLGGKDALEESLDMCMDEIRFIADHSAGHGLDKKAFLALLPGAMDHFKDLLKSEFAGTIILHIQDQAKLKLFFELTEKELADLLLPKQKRPQPLAAGAVTLLAVLLQLTATAQDGNAGINEATGKVVGYFDSGTSLMYAIGAIVGLVGAVKVYGKWNAGEPDTSKVATAWFGSCIFLVVVATVLKSFFGV